MKPQFALFALSSLIVGCASMSPADLCRETEDCPVFEFDEDRYPVPARDATIALTPYESGAWVTISGGDSPILGALGTPDQYKQPGADPALAVTPSAQRISAPSCADLRGGDVSLEGIVTGPPATATAPDGGMLAAWIEGTVTYSGSRFAGEGESMTCVPQQEPQKIAMKVARHDATAGTLEICYTLPLEDEPVYDIAVAASDSRLHFAIAGGTDRKTHIRYLSVDASELCTP